MPIKKQTPSTKKHAAVKATKPSKILKLAAALQGGRVDAAWARAADLPDQDAALDELVRKAGARKRLTLEQIRAIFPEIEADPEQIAKVLAGTLDDKTVVVASSDLSHYHPYSAAKDLDGRCVKAICDGDIDQMKTQEACGKLPILALMHLARLKGWKA